MLSTILTAKQQRTHGTAANVEDIAITGASASIGLAQRKVIEVESQLTDVLAHHLHLQLATGKVAGHETGKLGRHNVRQIVGDGAIASGHKDAANAEPHGAFALSLPAFLSTFIGIEAVAQSATIIRQTFSVHRHREEMNYCKVG